MRVIGKLNFPRLEPASVPLSVGLPPSDADVTERLMLEFEPLHGLRFLSEVVRICRRERRAVVDGAPPRSLELLARERLAAR